MNGEPSGPPPERITPVEVPEPLAPVEVPERLTPVDPPGPPIPPPEPADPIPPGSVGLLLNVGALIAFAVSLAAMGTGHGPLGGLVATAAVVGFIASLVCFVLDGRRVAAAEAVRA